VDLRIAAFKEALDSFVYLAGTDLNMAIQEFKNNWDVYIERWNKWREEKE
jgi:hypothetical protein